MFRVVDCHDGTVVQRCSERNTAIAATIFVALDSIDQGEPRCYDVLNDLNESAFHFSTFPALQGSCTDHRR